MDTFEDDNPKNLYVIRRKLAALRKPPGYGDWHLEIGNFSLSILAGYDEPDRDKPSVLDYKKVDISLGERNKRGDLTFIGLRDDPRFSSYRPIMYDSIKTETGGIVNFSDGHNMPILHLMELIKYLHRLAGLTAFQ